MARKKLEQIVGQINTESRQLFARTVEEVREHFRTLFTKLFGGGEADILVDAADNSDLLECGIDIVARPPGKQPRSISLLSGGERTLTCDVQEQAQSILPARRGRRSIGRSQYRPVR